MKRNNLTPTLLVAFRPDNPKIRFSRIIIADPDEFEIQRPYR